jgi:hypothetical protein
MTISSQQHPPQPSQESMMLGLPQGDPLRREGLGGVDPLPRELQDVLDGLMRGSGSSNVQPPVKTVRRQLGNRA